MSEFKKTDQALLQFNASIRQLGSALAARKRMTGPDNGARDDYERVSKELENLQSRAKQLADVNRKSGERIDYLIGEIKAILAAG